MNKENLEIALQLLPEVVKNNTDIEFNMYLFGGYEDLTIYDISKRGACGTTACAMGFFPLIPHKSFKISLSDYRWTGGEDIFCYGLYSNRVLGGWDNKSLCWSYLFGSQWGDYDNTIEGFLGRLTWALENWNEFTLEGFTFLFENKNYIPVPLR